MSESTHPATLEQRFVPRDRQSFFDAQRRNRRATWRLSVLCLLAVVIMGIPLSLIVTPFLYAVTLLAADIVNLFPRCPRLSGNKRARLPGSDSLRSTGF